MYWILIVMGFIVAIVLAVVVGGLATPRDHVASRSRTYPVSAARLWEVVRDVASYATWREDMIDVEMVTGEAPAVQWREISSGGTMTFGIISEEPPAQFVARVMDDDLTWGGTWTWNISPTTNGATLTLTEHGFIKNPIYRFVRAHFIGFDKSLEQYLRALDVRLRA